VRPPHGGIQRGGGVAIFVNQIGFHEVLCVWVYFLQSNDIKRSAVREP